MKKNPAGNLGRSLMMWKLAIGLMALALSCLVAKAQTTVVIHAEQLFDGKSDRLATKQVIVIQGDRIVEVGSEGSVKIPTGAVEIDLGTATVLPGLIEGHNHMFKVGNYPNSGSNAAVPLEIRPGTTFSAPYITILASINARLDLLSGFTTARDLSSGSTADVDLRNAINEGLIPGPRMLVATEGIRGSIDGPRYFHLIDSPWEGRKQVRIQLKNGADFIKVYAAGIRANPAMGYGAPTMTAEEQNAIVDEAHRQGVRVACAAHAGIAVRQSIEAGCDSLELVTDIDEQSVRMLVERGTYINFGLTITKLQATHQRFPMAEMSKASFQRALKAGAKIAFSVNATGARGRQEGRYHRRLRQSRSRHYGNGTSEIRHEGRTSLSQRPEELDRKRKPKVMRDVVPRKINQCRRPGGSSDPGHRCFDRNTAFRPTGRNK